MQPAPHRDNNSPVNANTLASSAQVVEVRYIPHRILKLEVDRYAPLAFILCSIAMTVILSMFEIQAPLLGVLVAVTLIYAALVAVRVYRRFAGMAGQIRLDAAGLWLGRSNQELTLLPWQDLVSVSIAQSSPQNNKLLFKFSSSVWNKAQRMQAERFQDTLNDTTQTVCLDLRAIPQRDHVRVRTAVCRFIPANKVAADLQFTAVDTPEGSFTQLWFDSLGSAPRRLSTARLGPGTRLNEHRYEIVRALASGGQGTAYAAIDTQAELTAGEPSNVVLKEFVVPVHGDRTSIEEMCREVEHLAKLLKDVSSDRIVKLYRTFAEDFRVYLVLEYVEGISLRELVTQQGPLPPSLTVGLARQMCAVLTHLHEQRVPVIHRDFAPDNLLYDEHGTLKLIDFDVALGDNSGSGKVVGKPSYIAPEQFRGQPVYQSDLYSLGATLFFLLTAKDPVPIATSYPSNLNPLVDQTLNEIVAKCTALETHSRYQSAREVLTALEQCNT